MLPALLTQSIGFAMQYACARLSSPDPRLDLHASYTLFDEFSVPLCVTREMDPLAIAELAPAATACVLRIIWMDPPKPGALAVLYWRDRGVLASSGCFAGLKPTWQGWKPGLIEHLDLREDPTRPAMMAALGLGP